MASEDSTLVLHRGFLGPPLRPQVTTADRCWGLARFWRRPTPGKWNLREPIRMTFTRDRERERENEFSYILSTAVWRQVFWMSNIEGKR